MAARRRQISQKPDALNATDSALTSAQYAAPAATKSRGADSPRTDVRPDTLSPALPDAVSLLPLDLSLSIRKRESPNASPPAKHDTTLPVITIGTATTGNVIFKTATTAKPAAIKNTTTHELVIATTSIRQRAPLHLKYHAPNASPSRNAVAANA